MLVETQEILENDTALKMDISSSEIWDIFLEIR